MKTVLIVTLVTMFLLVALMVYAICAAAGREDRAMERMYEKWELDHAGKVASQHDETEG